MSQPARAETTEGLAEKSLEACCLAIQSALSVLRQQNMGWARDYLLQSSSVLESLQALDPAAVSAANVVNFSASSVGGVAGAASVTAQLLLIPVCSSQTHAAGVVILCEAPPEATSICPRSATELSQEIATAYRVAKFLLCFESSEMLFLNNLSRDQAGMSPDLLSFLSRASEGTSADTTSSSGVEAARIMHWAPLEAENVSDSLQCAPVTRKKCEQRFLSAVVQAESLSRPIVDRSSIISCGSVEVSTRQACAKCTSADCGSLSAAIGLWNCEHGQNGKYRHQSFQENLENIESLGGSFIGRSAAATRSSDNDTEYLDCFSQPISLTLLTKYHKPDRAFAHRVLENAKSLAEATSMMLAQSHRSDVQAKTTSAPLTGLRYERMAKSCKLDGQASNPNPSASEAAEVDACDILFESLLAAEELFPTPDPRTLNTDALISGQESLGYREDPSFSFEQMAPATADVVDREAKLHLRREKNRAAAAVSNARRKARNDFLKDAVRERRELIAALEQRKAELEHENATLRRNRCDLMERPS